MAHHEPAQPGAGALSRTEGATKRAGAAPSIQRPTQRYDAIVIGGELAGLVAAAVLARRGFRVLLADDGTHAPDRTEGGFLLPNRPDLLPPLRALPSLHALVDELGLVPRMGRAIEAHPRGLQLVLEDARLDLAPEDEVRARELERAFGTRGPAWMRSLEALDLPAGAWIEATHHLPPQGWVDTWKLRGPARKLRGHLQGKETSDPLMDAAHCLHDLLAPAPEGLVGLSRTLSPWLTRPSRIEPPRLEGALAAFLASHRGETVGSLPRTVVMEKGFAGVQFDGVSVPHRGRVGILALPAERAAGLFSGRARRKVEAAAAQVEIQARQVTLNLVIDQRGLPPGLGSLALVRLGGQDLLLSVEPARRDDGESIEGLFTLTATANVLRSTSFEEAVQAMRTALGEVVPFFERHLRYEAALEGPAMRLRIARRRPLGIEGIDPSGPVRHTVWASRLCLPGLGLEGSLLAGLRAATIAQKWLTKGASR